MKTALTEQEQQRLQDEGDESDHAQPLHRLATQAQGQEAERTFYPNFVEMIKKQNLIFGVDQKSLPSVSQDL